ncbi:hypothetical protein SNEBB_000907 [Seison nebaliae]|nr:hypothetical protein SNEBB_000907 [Seison nebaliae]
MNDDDEMIHMLWRIKKTALQLCHDRGYVVTQQELDQTLHEFKAQSAQEGQIPNRDEMTIAVSHTLNKNDQMYIFFVAQEGKLGVKEINEKYFSKMQKASIPRCILITQKGLTSHAKNALNAQAPNYILEHFLECELLINITEHELVPRHIKLMNDQKTELLKKYKLKESQLPKIQAVDPVAKYYGLNRGDVVKIIRSSETAGRYITYRLVV